eukprot:CAMPEP_0196592526 /NCGR_PEP_ID=MMETSP1081-20130531/73005_1 /TAXON_ID=36882 /ORGANISM="Pyramimonas amylifera, Strain CCMP720" /LENGTH=176 /DNA_ID=CAMNT_0041916247 /DNA_START=68 /DNA_END=595 /DNA_ORIENTATION=-
MAIEKHQDSVETPGLTRTDLKFAIASMISRGDLPEGAMPYPSDKATTELSRLLGGVKEKLARKAVVDARLAGLVPGFPPGAHMYVLLNKTPQSLCARSEQTRFTGTRDTIYDILPPGTPPLPHVGRLDNNTSGLLLLTDDGQLGARLLFKQKRPEVVTDVCAPDRSKEGEVLNEER